MERYTCQECGDTCEAEEPGSDGCLCLSGECLFCEDSCSGSDL